MTAINFPDSPSDGDTHVVGGVTYTYNNAETKWKTTINSNAFLPLTGGTVSGNILMGGEIQHDGDTDTNIAFDTDTILFDTAGSERFRVGSAGQLGIGGATYGTSGQFLQSQGASAAPQWATVTADTGNDYNFASATASGSTITVSDLPSDAVKIVLTLNSVRWTDNSTTFGLRLGDSSSIASTAGDYTWSGVYTGLATSYHNRDSYFMLNHGFGSNAERMIGSVELNRLTNNAWHASYTGNSDKTGSVNYIILGSGWGYSGSSNPVAQLQLFVDVGTFNGGTYNVNVFTE